MKVNEAAAPGLRDPMIIPWIGNTGQLETMDPFYERLMEFPVGYSEGHYNYRRYAATYSISADGKRRKLYAEELGGNDRISFNLYVLDAGDRLLKPCEMPARKVIDFVLGYAPEMANGPCGRSKPS